jgi:hypothetical protein
MSLAKITKQLKREFKANPTKAAVLGVLVVVAAVFWGPLLFKSDDKPKKPAAAAGTVEVVGTPAAAPAAAARKAPAVDWRVLARGLEADPRMRTQATIADDADNPFRAKTADEENAEWYALLDELAVVEPADMPKVEAPKPRAFDEYPLTLSSTIVGKRFRSAVINGKARNIGAEIDRFDGNAVVLAEVEPNRAVVEWNGKRRALKLPKPGERPASSDVQFGAAPENNTASMTERDGNRLPGDGAKSGAPAAAVQAAER